VTDPSKCASPSINLTSPRILGNLRLAACLGVAVDIIEPCGFPLTDRGLRRTAMDYAENASVSRHSGWASFRESQIASGSRLILLTTRAATRLDQSPFRTEDVLLFGRAVGRRPGRYPQRRRRPCGDSPHPARPLPQRRDVRRHRPLGGSGTDLGDYRNRVWGHSITAHPDERRDPGLGMRLVPPFSFKPMIAASPVLGPHVRRDQRLLRNRLERWVQRAAIPHDTMTHTR